MAVDADDGDRRSQPEPLEDRRRRVAGELARRRARPTRAGAPASVDGSAASRRALVGVGRLRSRPSSRRTRRSPCSSTRVASNCASASTGSGTAPPAIPLCTGPSRARTRDVDAGEAPQRVGEAGRAHRPVAGVGEERARRTRSSSTCAARKAASVGRTDLLLALHQHLHVARELARGAQPGPHRGQRARPRPPCRRRCPDRRAGRRARRGSNGSRRPPFDVAGRLHVVMRVEQHGRRVGTVRPLADDVGVPAVDPQLAHVVQARRRAMRSATACRARVDVVGVRGIGADARDAHERLELALARRRHRRGRRRRPRSIESVHAPRLRCRSRASGRSSSYQSGACLRAHGRGHGAAEHALERVAVAEREHDVAEHRDPDPSANQSCTNVAPVRQSSGKRSNHFMIEPVPSITTIGAGDERGVELLAGVELARARTVASGAAPEPAGVVARPAVEPAESRRAGARRGDRARASSSGTGSRSPLYTCRKRTSLAVADQRRRSGPRRARRR